MKTSRRQFALKSGLGVLGAGFLARVDKVAAAQTSASSMFDLLQKQATGKSETLLLKATPGEEGPPAPTTDDRLSLDWNKRTVAHFKQKLAQDGIQAFLVRQPLNIIYLTGYWHTTTERPQAAFMNHDQADPWFMYPALDRDLIRSWWFGGGETYFDVKEAEGGFPNEGKVAQGKTVDLFRFLLEGIKKHGIQGNKIGLDSELYPSESAKAREILPDVEFVDVSQTLMDMRIVKTPEELALWSRAYIYFDRAHAFARDYILTHGTDVTDYEVALASELWINQQLYSDIKLANGAPHHGVQTRVELECRVGPVTAYPHPNQPYFNRIGRGMALQVSGGVIHRWLWRRKLPHVHPC